MTTSTVPGGGGGDDSMPYLPTRTPAPAPRSDPGAEPPRGSGDGEREPSDDAATGTPDLPPPPWAPPMASPPVFAPGELATPPRRVVPTPAYGDLPAQTEAGKQKAEQLREQGRKKRRRDQWVARVALVLLLAGFGALLYVAFATDPDPSDDAQVEQAAPVTDPTAADPSDEATPGDEATPTDDSSLPNGDTALIDDSSAPNLSSGADEEPESTEVASLPVSGPITVDTVDVGSDPESDPPVAPAGVVDDLLPPIMLEVGARLPDASGRETYVVPAAEFAEADPAAYDRFVSAAAARAQLAVDDPVFDGLPQVDAGHIVVSVEREGNAPQRILIVSEALGLAADITL